jgi:hypothetical protein
MRVRDRLFVLALAALTCGASGAAAQSLGDVAKKEQRRRETSKPAGKVYTNKDLAPATETPPSTAAPAAPASQTAGPGGAEPAASPATTDEQDPRKSEDYWRKRIETARAEISRNELFLEALQSRVNALSTDFVNRDDPAQRGTIAADRLKALAEMERVKAAIEQQKQQVAAIEEEARQAGVPPGWLR